MPERAHAVAPAMSLVMTLQAARHIADTKHGRMKQVDREETLSRACEVKDRLLELIG